jgi:parallel beta-helix repeat protein
MFIVPLLIVSGFAAHVRVPDDYAEIQQAIDACADGDTVTVREGEYFEHDIDFSGKGILVRSERGSDVTIVNCEGEGRGFTFISGETDASVLEGFTIVNGGNVQSGGAILCRDNSYPTIRFCVMRGNTADNGGGILCRINSSPAISDCVVEDNTVSEGGGGIHVTESSSPVLSNCVIRGNSAHDGGGIFCHDAASTPTIRNCVFYSNTAEDDGGGIHCHLSDTFIQNCTVCMNTANDRGGGIHCKYGSPVIVNCIVWGNAPSQISVLTGDPDVSFSNVEGGWEGEGNIDGDPRFKDAENGDYHLSYGSSCIDRADPDYAPDTDREGDYRWDDPAVDNEQGGWPWPDMGADEYLYVNIALSNTPDTVYRGEYAYWTLSIINRYGYEPSEWYMTDLWFEAHSDALPPPWNPYVKPIKRGIWLMPEMKAEGKIILHVPGIAPQGEYSIRVAVGEYPEGIIDYADFDTIVE